MRNAVNLAKDINHNEIPTIMKMGGINLESEEISESFTNNLEEKVKKIVKTCNGDNSAYNGKKKVNCNNDNFMTIANVTKAIKSINIKNCEGMIEFLN